MTSAVADTAPRGSAYRVGAAVLFAIAAFISGALAFAVWLWGYAWSQPITLAPVDTPRTEALANPLLTFAAVWAAAAVTELVAGVTCQRWPRAAIVMVVAAIAAGFAAILAGSPADPFLLPKPLAALVWLAPALFLGAGILGLLSGTARARRDERSSA